jgi:hypothetical protein
MNNGLFLLVDESAREEKQMLDISTGEGRRQQAFAATICKEYWLSWAPMAPVTTTPRSSCIEFILLPYSALRCPTLRSRSLLSRCSRCSLSA